jgi:hypothetical protein
MKIAKEYAAVFGFLILCLFVLETELRADPAPSEAGSPTDRFPAMVQERHLLAEQEMQKTLDSLFYAQVIFTLKQLRDYQVHIDSSVNDTEKKQYQEMKDHLVNESEALADENINEYVKTLAQVDKFLIKNEELDRQAHESLSALAQKQLNLAESIESYLTRESPDQRFKRIISIYFTVLVAIVIAGFFAVSFKYPEIGEKIFSGDSGLQFVTLFAVVIAIILFGVIGILDAKELAALLGGLSGYILGRNSSPSPNLVVEGAHEASTVGAPSLPAR